MSDLFKIEPTLSPRLKWIKEHRIKTKFFAADPFIYNDHWVAWTGKWNGDPTRPPDINGNTGMGDTEDEAITDWAIANKIKLWNE